MVIRTASSTGNCLSRSSRAQRSAVRERHDVERQSVRSSAVKERQQVWVLKLCHHPDLAQEAVRANNCRELRLQDLYRDAPIVLEVASGEDIRHSSATDLTLDGVAAGKRI